MGKAGKWSWYPEDCFPLAVGPQIPSLCGIFCALKEKQDSFPLYFIENSHGAENCYVT